jgi:hypothetical protein
MLAAPQGGAGGSRSEDDDGGGGGGSPSESDDEEEDPAPPPSPEFQEAADTALNAMSPYLHKRIDLHKFAAQNSMTAFKVTV